jgi:uncharacterized protein with HEPN domain
VNEREGPRSVEKLVGDLLDATSAAAEIIARGRTAWDQDRLLQLAAEAIINRIGDAAGKLPDDVRAAIPSIPWDDIRANRILVAHIYHRIDPDILWETLARDIPRLALELEHWRSREREVGEERTGRDERDTGLGIGF